jgi:hypothetical protein
VPEVLCAVISSCSNAARPPNTKALVDLVLSRVKVNHGSSDIFWNVDPYDGAYELMSTHTLEV